MVGDAPMDPGRQRSEHLFVGIGASELEHPVFVPGCEPDTLSGCCRNPDALDVLDESDDVQRVSANFEISDDVLARLTA